MNRTVFVVLLAFVAGGAIGYVAGSFDGGGAVGPRSAPAPDPAVPPGGDALPPAESEGPAVGRPAGPARGTGEIHGRVRTEAGEGVAGVRIIGEELVDEAPVPDGASLTEETRILARNRARVHAGRVRAESGADGAFLLAGLADAKYVLRAEREGYEFSGPSLGRLLRPGRSVEIVAVVVVALPVRVLMPDGSVARKARVEFRAEDRELERSEEWTGEEPALRVPPGTWRAKAVAGEGDEYASPSVSVSLAAGIPPDPLTLSLAARPGIRGHVEPPETWPEGQWITVAVLRAGTDAGPPDGERLLSEGRQAGCGEDSDFTFSFPDLKPGTYHVAAVGNSQQVLARVVVEVADRMAVVALVAQDLPRSAFILVHPEGPDGRPVELHGGVTCLLETDAGEHSWGGAAARRPDGAWAVEFPVEEGGGRVHRRVLVVASPAHGEKEVEFTRTEATEVTVRFGDAAWIDAEISGLAELEDGGGLRLAAFSEESRWFRFEGREVSEEGKARVGPLQPGSFRVRLLHQRPRGEVPILEQTVTVRAGANRLALRVPPLYDVTVPRDTGDEARWEFYLSMPDERYGWGVSGEAGPDGQVTFRGLPAGRYQLWGWRGDGENSSMDITLPGATTVRFDPRAQNALRVTVADPEGLLARSGFETGDLVIGIDGQEFEGGSHMFSLLQAAVSKKTAKFTVLRGNGSVTLDVSAGEVRTTGNWGGSLDPATR
ncbi:MAG: PDZ domain-containing protein [Planctomycetes bacterium]|nr:PDZ domain-containing protein [Planctomycetota bacterium]